ncbi:hypothetical protein N5C81_15095 [Rhizobium pusense]|uniref:hypothetical protein n=1 Tax=Agrobacterium pusense TaxID=648995 RepID=UPI002447B29E|nr:hypothetical protein [Agrobacterium pusense]MDH1268950.1 hypothetical protein [Agrobacterium pusense]
MTADSRPTERAMKAAVEMEMHAAVGTRTVDKGATLDKCFPAYDGLLDAANKTVDGLAEEYLITAECDDDWIYDTLGSVLAGAYFSARAAIAKAEGRS